MKLYEINGNCSERNLHAMTVSPYEWHLFRMKDFELTKQLRCTPSHSYPFNVRRTDKIQSVIQSSQISVAEFNVSQRRPDDDQVQH